MNPVPPVRPRWTPLSGQEVGTALVNPDSLQGEGKQFEIKWKYQNIQGTVKLNQSTKGVPDTIDIGKVCEKNKETEKTEGIEKTDDHTNLLVAVLTAKAAGWKGVVVYEEMPSNKRVIVQALCEQNGMKFDCKKLQASQDQDTSSSLPKP